MVEPHLFCGPEFILEIPADYPQPLQPDVLLKLQTELYNLLTSPVRCKIHATYGDNPNLSSSSNNINSASVLPPPNKLFFLNLQSSQVEEADNDEGVVRLILLITDSRAAAELYLICLKNPFVALPFSMRLRNKYTASGRNAITKPLEILQKKELLRSHMNFDEDLWKTLQESLTPEWLQEFDGQLKEQQEQKYGVGLLRESQRHEHCVESLLHYCEKHVHYVGMLDEEGNASPFLMSMGLFYHLGLTHREAILHFARHPRRTIRALALFIARYTVAPEELEPFFAPSLTDDVVIACTEDQQSTSSMRHLCEQLLLEDEVCEAWPPTYHIYWIEHKVRFMMQRVEAEYKRREELRLARSNDHLDKETTGNKKGTEKTKDGIELKGSGTGVGIFGFRNMRDLQSHVREKERVLIPQRILQWTLGRRKGDMDDDDDNDDIDNDDDDDDDFLIKVQVEGKSGTEFGQSNHQKQLSVQKQHNNNKQQETARAKRKRPREAFKTRMLVMTEAYRTILRLLGRTEPFEQRGEHYLRF
ncbi:uncharacterized protein TM35_000332040 [Trypanosoma theileri]|uniref:Pre-mRNA-splicing factor 38 n=1 Tax=Trypanosoma theileri TaxID=67003 RepID=A0A1X0NM33_9TRYP|nr:uncharacterized protein TM35_000332040 [Trypanosoma theileri]ORC85747.1 hypothetical protein TM35_000332040 [Trypanosoma theileri]